MLNTIKKAVVTFLVILVVVSGVAFALVLAEPTAHTPPLTEWNRTYGGVYDDRACIIAGTSEGGYAVAGYQTDSGGWTDFWLVKTDSSGNTQWNRTYGGIHVLVDSDLHHDAANSLVQTWDGGYALYGTTTSFGAGCSDAWLVKVDSSGNAQWNRTYGGPYNDDAYCVVETADGGYALAGAIGVDFWLLKTNSSGELQWEKRYGGADFDVANCVVQTQDGGYAIVGYSQSFSGPGPWLVRTDSFGNMQWNKTFPGAYTARWMVETPDGGFALAGVAANDFWLAKTDAVGNLQWQKTYGDAEGEMALSVAQTTDGGYALAGIATGLGVGFYNAWVVKTDSSGNQQWNKTLGGANDDWVFSVMQADDGGYVLAGFTNSFGAGNYDFWLIKLAADQLPVVDAGEDKFVSAGDTVTLDGSSSFDVEDPSSLLTFQWSQVETIPGKPYTSVVIADVNKAITTFTGPSTVETLTFKLTVTDSAGHSASDDVHVTVLEDTSRAIFVSSTLGDDFHPNAGTMEHPFRTLRSAAVRAQQVDDMGRRSDLYLQEGNYFPAVDPWYKLVLLDDMSIYGGFEAYKSNDGTVDGWTRTASKPTVICSLSRIMCTVEQQQYPITIDGLTVASYDAPSGSSRKSVAGGVFNFRDASQQDINEVWLIQSLDGWQTTTWTLLTSDFTALDLRSYYNSSWTYEVERSFNLPKLHDPSQEPNVDPYYQIRYYQQDIWTLGDPPTPNWYYLYKTSDFAPGINWLEGYEVIRETFVILNWGNSYLLQHLRGPDGDIYGYLPPIPWEGYEGNGPFRLEEGPSYWRDMCDLIDEGLAGHDSIGIQVLKTNNNLQLTNNVISAGRGGDGGHGTDGGDEGFWGNGGDGGSSIGVLVESGTPSISGNTIMTTGGGSGGMGAYGGDGGGSIGIKSGISMWWSSTYENNNFQIGPAGIGGNGIIPEDNGVDGRQLDIFPPPATDMPIRSLSVLMNMGVTSTTSATIPKAITKATFASRWGGSDIIMSLAAPSGRIITRDTVDPKITHILAETSESYTIVEPEAGDWIIQLYGADVPESGEEATIEVSGTPDLNPPVTSLLVGSPKYTNATGSIHVTSSTPLTLAAEDYYEVTSGVAATAYRIHNQAYDAGWMDYTNPFHLSGLDDGIYFIDYNSTDNADNTEPTETATVILDNTPPSTSLVVDDPKYVSATSTYLTPNTNFTLQAADKGSGVQSIAYRIYNTTYDSGWTTYATLLSGQQVKTMPIRLNWLGDGTYTIAFNCTDSVKNKEATHLATLTVFSWNYVFQDTYGRGTTLKINIAHNLFQFITPLRDYSARKANYMKQSGKTIAIIHCDEELRLITIVVDTKIDFCAAYARDIITAKQYVLIDKPGME